jgi:hypothetical protein
VGQAAPDQVLGKSAHFGTEVAQQATGRDLREHSRLYEIDQDLWPLLHDLNALRVGQYGRDSERLNL